MRWATHAKDGNHDEIFAAIRKITWAKDIHNAGLGLGDILARHIVTKLPVFIEVKPNAKSPLRESEAEMAVVFGRTGTWRRVNNVDEGIKAVTT